VSEERKEGRRDEGARLMAVGAFRGRERIRQLAERLAVDSACVPEITEVWWFPHEKEVRLVEVHSDAPPSEGRALLPFYFAPTPDFRAVTAVATVAPGEVGRLIPPEGWGGWESAVRLRGGPSEATEAIETEETEVTEATETEATETEGKNKGGLTEASGAEAVYWFKEVMGLQDWTVDLYVQDVPPAWVGDRDCWGMCQPISDEKRARIWVSPSGCLDSGYVTLEVLMHELGHMMMADAGVDVDTDFPLHFYLHRMAAVWAKAYKADREAGWRPER